MGSYWDSTYQIRDPQWYGDAAARHGHASRWPVWPPSDGDAAASWWVFSGTPSGPSDGWLSWWATGSSPRSSHGKTAFSPASSCGDGVWSTVSGSDGIYASSWRSTSHESKDASPGWSGTSSNWFSGLL